MVSVSLVALGPLNMPVVVIRSMRAFRIARIFRRIGVIRANTAHVVARACQVAHSCTLVHTFGYTHAGYALDKADARVSVHRTSPSYSYDGEAFLTQESGFSGQRFSGGRSCALSGRMLSIPVCATLSSRTRVPSPLKR